MVYAFIIQTLSSTGCDILYYRVYCCCESAGLDTSTGNSAHCVTSHSDTDSLKSHYRTTKLFETSVEKKEFLQYIAQKIQTQYCLKVKHSLIPVQNDCKDNFMRGVFMERKWKVESGSAIQVPVIWQGIPGLGFALICKKTDNFVQAQNVLDIIINALEKYLQFVSNPVIPLTLVETVALIVNQFLPSGQLLFMNSKLLKAFEKQLEADLFAK